MPSILESETAVAARRTPQYALGRIIALSFTPAIPALMAYTLGAAIVTRAGLPNLFALYASILLAETPLCWAVMINMGRKESGRLDWRELLPYRQPVSGWFYALAGVPLILFSTVMIGAVAPAVGNHLRPLFAWLPDWFALSFEPSMFTEQPRGTLVLLWVLAFISGVLLGGPTQEIYFRGFLLPRMKRYGWWAPVLNTFLFILFHLASPTSWPVFFVTVLPWAYIVYWKRSLMIGIFIHVGMLLLQTMLMALLVFGFAQLPG